MVRQHAGMIFHAKKYCIAQIKVEIYAYLPIYNFNHSKLQLILARYTFFHIPCIFVSHTINIENVMNLLNISSILNTPLKNTARILNHGKHRRYRTP